MKIKVCGITSFEQMVELQNLGADYVGLIFYEGSKRFIGNRLEAQQKHIQELEIAKVGVFVNASPETIQHAVDTYGLSAVQLHGNETPTDCAALMTKVSVIKAFQVSEDTDIDAMVKPYYNSCNYFLLDNAWASFGGSGQQFNWRQLDDAIISKLFFLSGGIGPDDAERLGQFYHSFLYAVDINSRFETEPGVKDLAQVEAFINRLKEAHAEN